MSFPSLRVSAVWITALAAIVCTTLGQAQSSEGWILLEEERAQLEAQAANETLTALAEQVTSYAATVAAVEMRYTVAVWKDVPVGATRPPAREPWSTEEHRTILVVDGPPRFFFQRGAKEWVLIEEDSVLTARSDLSAWKQAGSQLVAPAAIQRSANRYPADAGWDRWFSSLAHPFRYTPWCMMPDDLTQLIRTQVVRMDPIDGEQACWIWVPMSKLHPRLWELNRFRIDRTTGRVERFESRPLQGTQTPLHWGEVTRWRHIDGLNLAWPIEMVSALGPKNDRSMRQLRVNHVWFNDDVDLTIFEELAQPSDPAYTP